MLTSLEREPRSAGCLKWTGRDGWLLRLGNYRLIYEIDDKLRQVVVLDIGDRKEIYRRTGGNHLKCVIL